MQEAQQERNQIVKEARARKDVTYCRRPENEAAARAHGKILEAARKDVRQEKEAAITDLKKQLAGFTLILPRKSWPGKSLGRRQGAGRSWYEKYIEDIKFN
ncbi:MAG: hypothetical protein U5L09_11540 [Bacteroidales bacterium]|nr:hypothetical protein [Bacteroidales bacterium]